MKNLFKIQNSKFKIPSGGFTLLEVVITIGIVAIVGALGMASFVNSRNVRQLSTTGQDLISTMRTAQSRSLAGQDDTVWGVRLSQTSFALFRGPNYATSTSIQTTNLSSALEIVSINLNGGGQDVVFKKIDGRTVNYGTLDLRIKNTTQVFQITIESSGKVLKTISSGTPPASSRVVDTRHRQFNLGWSIQTATTMALTFYDPPNPNTVQSVIMSGYFNGDKSVFDWSGGVTVGGQIQTLRIHTITLTSGNTVLSVDRDCRYNTKKLNIAIDTKDIATYEADCQTMTVGPWGGTAIEP